MDANRQEKLADKSRVSQLTVKLAASHLVVLLLTTGILMYFYPIDWGLRWAGLTGLFLIIELRQFFMAVWSMPVPPKKIGVANMITLSRGVLIALLGGMLIFPEIDTALQIAVAVAYSLAAIADFVDGFVARKLAETSPLGEKLDGDFDALGIAIAPLLGIKLGQLPWLYLLVGVAYYLFLFGIYYRRRKGKPIQALVENQFRRTIAGFQMGFLAVILYPVYGPPETIMAAYIFMTPFLAVFLFDWLCVSGRIHPGNADFQKFVGKTEKVFFHWLPLLFRIVIILIVITPAFSKLIRYPEAVAMFSGLGVPGAKWVVVLVGILEVASVFLIFLGIAGRYAAFCLMFIMGAAINYAGLDWMNSAVLFSSIYIEMFDTGRYSLGFSGAAVFTDRLGKRTGKKIETS